MTVYINGLVLCVIKVVMYNRQKKHKIAVKCDNLKSYTGLIVYIEHYLVIKEVSKGVKGFGVE